MKIGFALSHIKVYYFLEVRKTRDPDDKGEKDGNNMMRQRKNKDKGGLEKTEKNRLVIKMVKLLTKAESKK